MDNLDKLNSDFISSMESKLKEEKVLAKKLEHLAAEEQHLLSKLQRIREERVKIERTIYWGWERV